MDEGGGTTMWLVCDYGDVISLSPTPDDVARVAELCGLDLDELSSAYWARRIDYDRGDIDARAFWSEVARGELSDERLAACVEVDLVGWTRLNALSTAAIERAADRGLRLALLSNAPVDIARALDTTPWLARFEHRVFSCDLRLTKPDPAIYHALLGRLGAEPTEVVFVDDRPENVAAAAALGMGAVRFTGPEVFDSI